MYTDIFREEDFLPLLSESDGAIECVKKAIEKFKAVRHTINNTEFVGGQLFSPLKLKYRSNDEYEVHKGIINTIWYTIGCDFLDIIRCEFSQYVVYSFKLSGKNGNWGTYKKTYRDNKKSNFTQDITLTEYIEDEDIKWLVDSTLDMFFEKSSKELLNKIANEGFKCDYSLNTILNPKNKTKADIITQRGKYKLPKSIEKYPFVYGLFLREASKVFSEDAMSFFYSFDKAKQFVDSIKNGGFGLKHLLSHGCNCLLWPQIDPNVVYDYLKCCIENKVNPNISIKSEETMLDNLIKLETQSEETKEMDIDKAYLRLEKLLHGKYHLLRKNSEMIAESLRQKNCVRTYIYAVNNHRCGIFNYDKDDKHYTIEVRYSKGRGYECIQFYGFANSYDEKCKELNEIFNKELNEINEEIENKRLKREVA